MATINDPNTSAYVGNVGPVSTATQQYAQHVSPRPIAYGTNGHYSVSNTHVIPVSASANGRRFALRNSHASKLVVITFIRLWDYQLAAATATIAQNFQVFVQRSFTVFDTTNATAFTLTGNNQKRRTTMATSNVANASHSAAVAAGMTGATTTPDAHPVMELPTLQTITAVNLTFYQVERDFSADAGGHPIVLAQNEGIAITGPHVVSGAAGTQQFGYTVAWAEVDAY